MWRRGKRQEHKRAQPRAFSALDHHLLENGASTNYWATEVNLLAVQALVTDDSDQTSRTSGEVLAAPSLAHRRASLTTGITARLVRIRLASIPASNARRRAQKEGRGRDRILPSKRGEDARIVPILGREERNNSRGSRAVPARMGGQGREAREAMRRTSGGTCRGPSGQSFAIRVPLRCSR